jgi:uncharacterized protein with HEPN domain
MITFDVDFGAVWQILERDLPQVEQAMRFILA